jgi:hypothetical protein
MLRNQTTPNALAERHAKARERYEQERQAVIDLGTSKIEEIVALREELEREEAAHKAVVSDAQNA